MGAEDQLPGLAYGRLLRELRHCNWFPAQRRLRGRDEKRAEQVAATGYSLADRAHRSQPGATGSREMFRLRQPSGVCAGDGFRQRLDNLLCEIAPAQTRGVRDDRQDCRPHARSRFDDLAHRNRGHVGPAHQWLAQQRFDPRIAQDGVAPRVHRARSRIVLETQAMRSQTSANFRSQDLIVLSRTPRRSGRQTASQRSRRGSARPR